MSAGAILVVSLLVLMAIGLPVFFCISLSSAVMFMATGLRSINAIAQKAVTGMDSFVLLAVPLFTLAGYIMESGGLSKRLVEWVEKLFGRVNGAAGAITIVCCAVFAALTGSGPATVAAIGAVMWPSLMKAGYKQSTAAGMLAAGGALGPIIPPSVAMIVYGSTMGVSIPDMFMGGVIPGIIIAILFCILNHFIAKKEGVKKSDVHYTAKEVLTSTVKALPVLFMPVMVLGGIYGGIFTPTEAATICVIYSCLLSIAYKEMNFKKFWEIIKRTIVSSATIALVIGISSVFGLALATANIPNKVAQALVPILHNKTIYLLVLIAFLTLVGTLMETLAAIVIIAPILTPIGIQLGCDPLHLGVLFCIVLVIGFITPPFGVNLFTAVSTTNTPYVKVVKGVWPFIIVGFAALFLFAFVPEIITFLPSLT